MNVHFYILQRKDLPNGERKIQSSDAVELSLTTEGVFLTQQVFSILN